MAFVTRSLPTGQNTQAEMGTEIIYAALHELQHSSANPLRLVQSYVTTYIITNLHVWKICLPNVVANEMI